MPIPDSLVSTEWLAEHLGTPGLIVFDCHCVLRPDPDTVFTVESARADFEDGHIPGAGFLDLAGDLSDPDGRFRFTMPTPARLAELFGAAGIGDDSTVVLYGRDNPSWPCRIWWMLRVAGFDNAAVLDGGLTKWRAERRPVESGANSLPPTTLTPHPRPELVVDADGVAASLAAGGAVVNALSAEQHRGEGVHYGRPGHIDGSVNVPTGGLVDPETKTFRPADEIRAMFEAAGVLGAPDAVPYCGGGIAASTTAYWLVRLGHPRVRLYDNSLSEWAADPARPMAAG